MGLITEFKDVSFAANPIFAVHEFSSVPAPADTAILVLFNCVVNGRTKSTRWNQYFDEVSGRTVVRADEYLSGMMAGEFDFPDPSAVIPFDCPNSIGEFDYEITGDYASTLTGGFQVMRGGLPFQVYPDTDYFTDIYPTKKFLTWHPDSKKVLPTSKEYLYFLKAFSGSTSFKVKVTLNFTDGTSTNYDAATHSVTGVSPLMQVFGVPVGYVELDIASHLGGKVVWHYDVVITDSGGTPISESRKYYVDYDYYHNSRVFHWANSINGVDTLIATGQAKSKSAITSQTLGRIVQHDYGVTAGQKYRTNILEQYSLKVSTGFKDQQTISHYRDMLLSKHVVEEVNGRFLPIEIIPGSFAIEEEGAFLPSLEFEYRYLYQNSVFAP
jgi:hypothetical protein